MNVITRKVNLPITHIINLDDTIDKIEFDLAGTFVNTFVTSPNTLGATSIGESPNISTSGSNSINITNNLNLFVNRRWVWMGSEFAIVIYFTALQRNAAGGFTVIAEKQQIFYSNSVQDLPVQFLVKNKINPNIVYALIGKDANVPNTGILGLDVTPTGTFAQVVLPRTAFLTNGVENILTAFVTSNNKLVIVSCDVATRRNLLFSVWNILSNGTIQFDFTQTLNMSSFMAPHGTVFNSNNEVDTAIIDYEDDTFVMLTPHGTMGSNKFYQGVYRIVYSTAFNTLTIDFIPCPGAGSISSNNLLTGTTVAGQTGWDRLSFARNKNVQGLGFNILGIAGNSATEHLYTIIGNQIVHLGAGRLTAQSSIFNTAGEKYYNDEENYKIVGGGYSQYNDQNLTLQFPYSPQVTRGCFIGDGQKVELVFDMPTPGSNNVVSNGIGQLEFFKDKLGYSKFARFFRSGSSDHMRFIDGRIRIKNTSNLV